MSEFAPPISGQLLLDAIVHDPDCLEPGLRLLVTDRTSEKKASVASGFDRNGRPGPTSPGAMRAKLNEMIVNSTVCRAKIESINQETGEYRIVLQGSIDKEENRFE